MIEDLFRVRLAFVLAIFEELFCILLSHAMLKMKKVKRHPSAETYQEMLASDWTLREYIFVQQAVAR